jgi:hypothetical protein
MEKVKALLAVVLFVAMLLVMSFDKEARPSQLKRDAASYKTNSQPESDTLRIY